MDAVRMKRHSLTLLAAAMLAGCSASSVDMPARVVDQRTSEEPMPRGASLLKSVMLAGHNEARAAVGVPPLAWDEGLAADAAAYAQVLAHTGKFEHAKQTNGPGREGENLFTGTRDAYSYAEMVGLWVAEKKDFVNLPTPAFSRTGNGEAVAHYTQIVWRATTAVGCAVASIKTDDYLVCRYSPPGNVYGQRAF
jgi:hypothetical protein